MLSPKQILQQEIEKIDDAAILQCVLSYVQNLPQKNTAKETPPLEKIGGASK